MVSYDYKFCVCYQNWMKLSSTIVISSTTHQICPQNSSPFLHSSNMWLISTQQPQMAFSCSGLTLKLHVLERPCFTLNHSPPHRSVVKLAESIFILHNFRSLGFASRRLTSYLRFTALRLYLDRTQPSTPKNQGAANEGGRGLLLLHKAIPFISFNSVIIGSRDLIWQFISALHFLMRIVMSAFKGSLARTEHIIGGFSVVHIREATLTKRLIMFENIKVLLFLFRVSLLRYLRRCLVMLTATTTFTSLGKRTVGDDRCEPIEKLRQYMLYVIFRVTATDRHLRFEITTAPPSLQP
ncbi:hypothetical protein HanHA300_Chr06g0207961 [Helianthus annuus]|nr:hypothetical protein HanHA300_Chr06g0207961 [Helianthus annuus]KAJ0573118.1 hypothetical protein HanHA89_Chr06g0223261 [Helianthus annuus]